MNSAKLRAVKEANRLLKDSLMSCSICPRRCGVDRTSGAKGYCRSPQNPVVYSYMAHRGEEPPISGRNGSGTIFFSHCTMKCLYCQNYRFSQLDEGVLMTISELADTMLLLQKRGCHNINLVSPSHFLPQILRALEIALLRGLEIPIVYNTSGYDLAETIRILDGIVDIYMPDIRYSDSVMAARYSDAADYVERNREAIMEMQRQAGDLVVNENGIAIKGLLIRLLVLPMGISGTVKSLGFIKEVLGTGAYLSIMSQYYPTFKACEYNEISRGITTYEYKIVVDEARLLGLNNGWTQDAPSGFDPGFFGMNIEPRGRL